MEVPVWAIAIPAIVEVTFYIDRMMENTSKLATCPFELTREDIEKIYRESIVVE